MSGTISTVTDDEYLTSRGFENAMARAEFTSSLARSDEWKAITGAALAPGDMLKIQAVAGAGKTTVLTDFMAQRPQERFLFVAYNKSIVDSFPARFREAGLENVEVRTMHSIAFEGTRPSSLIGRVLRPSHAHLTRLRFAPWRITLGERLPLVITRVTVDTESRATPEKHRVHWKDSRN